MSDQLNTWKRYQINLPRLPQPVSLEAMSMFLATFGAFVIDPPLKKPLPPRRLAHDHEAVLTRGRVRMTDASPQERMLADEGVRRWYGVVTSYLDERHLRRRPVPWGTPLRDLPPENVELYLHGADYGRKGWTGRSVIRRPHQPDHKLAEMLREGTHKLPIQGPCSDLFFEADYSTIEPVVPGVNDWWRNAPPGVRLALMYDYKGGK